MRKEMRRGIGGYVDEQAGRWMDGWVGGWESLPLVSALSAKSITDKHLLREGLL